MAKTNESVANQDVTTDKVAVQVATEQSARDEREARQDEPVFLSSDAQESAKVDARNVLLRGLADRKLAEQPLEEIDPEQVDTPTGEMPNTIEEALAMVAFVGDPTGWQGYQALSPSNRDAFEAIYIRPGTRVRATVDAYDARDLHDKVTLIEGDMVPDGNGYVPANYVNETARLRILGK